MFDLDGVLRDFDSSWQRAWHKHMGSPPDYPNPLAWDRPGDAAVSIGLPRERGIGLVLGDWGYEVMSQASCYRGALMSVARARANGWRIIVATDQPNPQCRAGTLTWLKRHRVPYDMLVWAKDKRVVKANVYFEDKTQNLIQLALTYPKSTVYWVKRGWNQDLMDIQKTVDLGLVPIRNAGHVLFGLRSTWERNLTWATC